MQEIEFDVSRFRNSQNDQNQYQRQLERLRAQGKAVDCVETAVRGALGSLSETSRTAFVIYGEPQSGKTEMMICLTAKLLDSGRHFILHLLNDSVDLLGQNLGRFQASGLAPSAKNFTDILDPAIKIGGRQHVIFCKKNGRDLEKLLNKIGQIPHIVIIDDEADFASPNAKINKNTKTKINALITNLLGDSGDYIGVTATPARLDLNNTFDNDSSLWVDFPPHALYTGQDVFFPLDTPIGETYILSLLPNQYDGPKFARQAFFSFLVNVAYLNKWVNATEQNYSMLVHTSGKKVDHKADWYVFDKIIASLLDPSSNDYARHVEDIWQIAKKRYTDVNPNDLTTYVVDNISRYALIILNSDRDFIQNGAAATNPSSLFTLIIGGNIVSRGVTFDNLVSMFFTRDVKQKIQQDTYIQRARMFGSRGKYLRFFELTIPEHLYEDWHRCFVFHRLALAAIREGIGSPVWLSDNRIAAVASASIDRSTVDLDKGEMAFRIFRFDPALDDLVASPNGVSERLDELSERLGELAFPSYLKRFITRTSPKLEDALAIHPSSSIGNYKDTEDGLDKNKIERRRGFMGTNQLERTKYPLAVHHLKIFRNAEGNGRLFYKFDGSIQFIKNIKR
jgi:hypothetical protein